MLLASSLNDIVIFVWACACNGASSSPHRYSKALMCMLTLQERQQGCKHQCNEPSQLHYALG